jgi:hypothetical protein
MMDRGEDSMGSSSGTTDRSIRYDPHAPRRRKRRTFSLVASHREAPPLIYTLQTLLC